MGGKGSGRPFGDKNKIDAFDPDTWPANDKRRLEQGEKFRNRLSGVEQS